MVKTAVDEPRESYVKVVMFADPDLETVKTEVSGADKVVMNVTAVTGKQPIDKKTLLEIGVANSTRA